jgi:hypothetical protein
LPIAGQPFGFSALEEAPTGYASGEADVDIDSPPAGTYAEGEAIEDGGARVAAFSSKTRWTRSRVSINGKAVAPSALGGKVTLSESLDEDQRTATFDVIGPLWPFPSQDGASVAESGGDGGTGAGGSLPKAWGHQDCEIALSLGDSPRRMVETVLLHGLTLRKSNSGDLPITGQVSAVDASILFDQQALCLEISPFSGLSRLDVSKLAYANVGGDPAKVIGPAGGKVDQAIQLSNASLLPFLRDLWAPVNGRPWIDDDINLVIDLIEMKDVPDFVLDARLDDFDINGVSEEMPDRPVTVSYATAIFPRKHAGDGDTPLVLTTVETDSNFGYYNPRCRANYPGAVLLGDGSYGIAAVESLQKTAEIVTSLTTVDGRLTRRVVSQKEFFDEFAYDPNFNTNPPTAVYTAAFGDKTFRARPAEILQETLRTETSYEYDGNGTPLSNTEDTYRFYAIRGAGPWIGGLQQQNGGGFYVYPGGEFSIQQTETFQLWQRVVTRFIYGQDGALREKVVTTLQNDATKSRASIFGTRDVTTPTPAPTPPPPVPTPSSPGVSVSLTIGPVPTPPVGVTSYNGQVTFSATASRSGTNPTGTRTWKVLIYRPATVISPTPAVVAQGQAVTQGDSMQMTLPFPYGVPNFTAQNDLFAICELDDVGGAKYFSSNVSFQIPSLSSATATVPISASLSLNSQARVPSSNGIEFAISGTIVGDPPPPTGGSRSWAFVIQQFKSGAYVPVERYNTSLVSANTVTVNFTGSFGVPLVPTGTPMRIVTTLTLAGVPIAVPDLDFVAV